jgi:release factor glutamine methyltransferase
MEPDWRGRIIASDISPVAISIAARNRIRLDAHRRIALVQGSLITWLRGPVDLLIANLPYLRPAQIAGNPSLAAEPRLALDGGPDGLDLIRRLLDDAPRVLAPGGAIGLEIDPSQSDDVVSMARWAFPGSEIEVLPDLAGFARHVTIETKSR